MDRISGLPPLIIDHIMSYLSAKEVARISILSKRWNHLRISFSNFDFDQTDFLTEDESVQIISVVEEERLALRDRLKEFMEFVDASLLRFCELKFYMQKFRLYISILDVEESAPYIEKWIGLAIEKKVKEFDLQFLKEPYTLPQTIFSARSVTTLKLVSCKLDNISDTIRFNSLKKLSLDRVIIKGEMVQKLCSECPLLEEMFFSGCWGPKRLCVSKALKLKIMTINSCELESVQIVVPNLQELELKLWEREKPREVDIIGCSQLKKLNFAHFGLTDKKFHLIISSLPLLEDLILEHCDGLETITISSNQLKKFRVNGCVNLKALDLDTPNLLSFTYMDSPIPTSRINALCPWKILCSPNVKFDTQWCLKLKEFIEVSNQIEALTISVPRTMTSFNLDDFRESFPSPSCNVGNLELRANVSPLCYRILLNCLLWMCYPRTLSLFQYSSQSPDKLFESFYNEWKNRDLSCCSSHDVKCWRHYLKDIKFESFLGSYDGKLIDADKLMNLRCIYPWYTLPAGTIKCQLDWCFPLSIEKA